MAYVQSKAAEFVSKAAELLVMDDKSLGNVGCTYSQVAI